MTRHKVFSGALFVFLFFLSVFSLTHSIAKAKKGGAAGSSGAVWVDQKYSSELLGMVQGATHRLWTKQAKGWIHSPIEPSNEALEEWWCQGATIDESICWTGSVAGRRERDVAWRGMGAGYTDGQIDRMWLTAGMFPKESVWGVSLHLDLGGKPLRVENFEVQFLRFIENSITVTIKVEPVVHYYIERSEFDSNTEVGILEFNDLILSTEQFRDAASQQVTVLQERVLNGIDHHKVKKCSFGRYYGSDPPPCKLVPLDSEEEEGWKYSVRRELGQRSTLIKSDSEMLYSLLVGLLPKERSVKSLINPK